MWRFIAGSVTGPSHAKTGKPCQDSQLSRTLVHAEQEAIVCCVADGAGSAEFSQEGSALACDTIVELATAHFEQRGGTFAAIDDQVAIEWSREARDRIQRLADSRERKPRDFATTLLVACVSPGHAAFWQVGDGAIVARRNGVFGVVFWPDSGEYANTTTFLTVERFEEHVAFQAAEGNFSDLALFTDGIERQALSFEGQTPHPPFFDPLFGALRSATDPAALNPELVRFLNSESMKARSDDDKTVVLAAHTAAR